MFAIQSRVIYNGRMAAEDTGRKRRTGGLVLGGLVLALAGFLVGGYGGSQLAARYLLNQALDRDARDIRQQVRILEHMQVGDTGKARDMLEARLDDNLVILDPVKPYEGVTKLTKTRIQEAIKEVRAYRQQFPRHSGRPHVDQTVRKILDEGPNLQ